MNASNADQGAEIWKSPTANPVWTNVRPKTIPGCSLTSFDQVGTYYVACTAFDSGGGQCSGNPWCPWSPVALPEDLCSGWGDCGPSDLLTVNVTNPGPWWQADSGNIHANNGNVSSNIPAGADLPYLITGISGLASYTGTLDTGEGTINETGDEWQAKTSYQGFQTDYGYFEDILQDDPAPRFTWEGSEPTQEGVYEREGNIDTSGFNINDIKIVILVDGDVTITGDINVDTNGFLAIIASGKIIIDPGVTNLQGVYIADKTIETGESADQLQAEGIFVGWDKNNDGNGINLQRNLAVNTTPAEIFTYRPDLVRNAYQYLKKPKIDWQEVAP